MRLDAGHLNNGLRLIKREIWQADIYKGESFEVYNNSKKSIKLNPSWFAGNAVKAVKLSKMTLAPKDKASLYRIEEVAHG